MGLLERLERQKAPPQPEKSSSESASDDATMTYVDEYAGLKDKIHGEIIEIINQEVTDNGKIDGNRESYVLKSIEALADDKGSAIPRTDRARLIKEIYNNVWDLAPLSPFLPTLR